MKKPKGKKKLEVKLSFMTSQDLIVTVEDEDFDLEELIEKNANKLPFELDWEFDDWEFINEDEGE